MGWITDWAQITDEDVYYIVCPINQRGDGGPLYLGQPIGRMAAWQVRRLLPRCYAALPCPPFDPEAMKE